jgi:hypothetical protein
MTLVQANQQWGPGFQNIAVEALTLLGLLYPYDGIDIASPKCQ